MKIAIVAPSPIPFALGGAENVYMGLFQSLNKTRNHQAELVKIPVRDVGFWNLLNAYSRFASLDLSHFDAIISLKYPAWMVRHQNHTVYMQHKLRGLYDTYAYSRLPLEVQDVGAKNSILRRVLDLICDPDPPSSRREEILVKVLGLLERASKDTSIPRDYFNFPGPFIRKLIHFVDGLALTTDSIRSFNAISRTVATRPQYFPDNVAVSVFYHPTNLAVKPRNGGDFFFTVSRLEKAKRIDLLIEAFLLADVPYNLVIGGTGPDRKYFESIAAGDARVQFIGWVSEDQLVDYYSKAIAVLFAPYDEDFGLIVLEAMGSAKPVITTTDAGGPTELIASGINGLICAPTATGIAAGIVSLAERPSMARDMGQAARDAIANITWENLIAGLLQGIESKSKRRKPGLNNQATSKKRFTKARPLLVGLSTFGGAGARYGGPLRVQNIYRRLSAHYDVVVLVLGQREANRCDVAPGYTEITIPVSEKYMLSESNLSRDVDWVPVSDLAFPLLYRFAPDYLEAAKQFANDASLVMLEQPYLWPAVMRMRNIREKLIVDAHNMELLLKKSILPDTRQGHELLSVVHSVEAEACEAAKIVLACSQEDGNLFRSVFGVAAENIWIVPNGVDCQATVFVPFEERLRRRFQLGCYRSEPLAYFIGSWHGPNIEAAKRIIECARSLPMMRFVIGGTVGAALKQLGIDWPSNTVVTGALDAATNRFLLSISGVALNPMCSGSGTNLKVFEYAAAGAPIVSTKYGVRGTSFAEGGSCEIAPLDNFEEGIVAATCVPTHVMADRVTSARSYVEAHFDWDVIFNNFYSKLRCMTQC